MHVLMFLCYLLFPLFGKKFSTGPKPPPYPSYYHTTNNTSKKLLPSEL